MRYVDIYVFNLFFEIFILEKFKYVYFRDNGLFSNVWVKKV